ncbi:dihydrodipicolinate synthase family protein [Microbacterium sp. A93]|uniref:dihydrodipicolinate synthase family protein n=1 Tax=Microbacterium sp. A93 TaxID=3450716 RepID=UPI003F4451CF
MIPVGSADADAPTAVAVQRGRAEIVRLLRRGLVIPAMPLALDSDRRFSTRHQKALGRYYAASGAGGLAVGVHTTQFEIRDPEIGLFEPVLEVSAEVLDENPAMMRIAGVAGSVAEAVAEAETAARLGYEAVLLSPPRYAETSDEDMITRARAVAEVLPVIGFYLQEAIGGPRLSPTFWREFVEIENVVAVKVAPFDRYRTLDVVEAVLSSDRAEDVALYTGNDDNIVGDLFTPFESPQGTRWFDGGLLGQWAVGTRAAVRLLDTVRAAREGDSEAASTVIGYAPQLTALNAAVFDVANDFRGCIAGVNAILHRQGLLPSGLCLGSSEVLSPGQEELIAQAHARYPWFADDEFIQAHRDEWLR